MKYKAFFYGWVKKNFLYSEIFQYYKYAYSYWYFKLECMDIEFVFYEGNWSYN